MGEIHKLTKDGITLFPATITDAIAHPELRTTLSNLITVYNVSNLYPDNNITTLNEAIELLEGKLKDEQKVSGIKVQFISETGLQEWMYNGNTFDNISNWSRCDSWYTYTDEETPDINDLEVLTADALRKTKQDLTNEERKQVKENIGIADSVISTTWADLKERKDSGTLIPGQYYEINDYKTTTTQENTKSAEHYFNILVEATSTTELNSEAKATISNRDLYFNGIELNKWIIRYDIENNQTKYAWADPVNGRGTIYYLKDEWNNEAWYDFKNIQFLRNCNDEKYSWIGLEENQYFYTFSRIETGNIIDDSLGTGQYPSSDNHLGRSTAKITKLNNTIFIGNGAFANEIADGHRDNTIGEGTWLNKIGHNFIENNITGVFQENNIGSKFSKNTLYKFTKNTILNDCDSNVFSRVFTQNIIESGFKNNVFLFADSNELGTVSGCKFGNNTTKVIDIPACFEKVTIDNNALNLSTETSTTGIILFDGKNLSTLINELDDEDSGIEKRGVVISKFRNNLVYNINSSIGIYDLGEFNTSGDAENAAKQINISYNKNISIIKYSVVGDTSGEGIILQQVGNLNTTQRLYWGGKIYKRQLTFTILAGNITSINNPSWTEILNITSIGYADSKIQLKDESSIVSEYELPIATPSVYSVVKLDSDYTKDTEGTALSLAGAKTLNENKLDKQIEITYSDLVSKRDNSELIPGQKYRIIDYITTTAQESTISAEHQFDIIVEALSENVLNETASACLHEGDTYFSEAGAKLEAWKIWYCLDNDTSRFAWADIENGKGVIYRMIDEWYNDCQYDFKNIIIIRCKIDGNFTSTVAYTQVKDKSLEILQDMYNSGYINLLYCGSPTSTGDTKSFDSDSKTTCGLIKDDIKSFYTFSIIDSDGNIKDYSLTGNCTYNKLDNYYNSSIPFILLITSINSSITTCNKFEGFDLCNIQLLSIDVGTCYNNFSDRGRQIYLADPFLNKISDSNFLYSSNRIYYMTLTSANSIYFGSTTSHIVIRSSSYNAFSNGCQQIQLAETCNYNSFGNSSNCITLEVNCAANSFGNRNSSIHLFENTDHFGIYSDAACTIPKDYVDQMCVYGGRAKFYNTEEVNENNWIQNLEINCAGLSGKKELPIPTNTGYLTKVACNSKGEMKVYCEADLIQ